MRRAASLALAGTLGTLGGCVAMQSPLDPAGAGASVLLSLLVLMGWVCGIMYALVLGFLGWSLLKKRHAGAGEAPQVEPPDEGLVRGLGVWAGLIVAGLLVLSGASFLADRSLAGDGGEGALQIRVTGHQWWWRVEYRDPAGGGWIETANEIHLPLNRPARIELGSADVIHSFWLPNLSGKRDMIPGRANALDLVPTRPGRYRGQCAEFCGTQHAHMALDVTVEEETDFAAWLAGQKRPAAAPADRVLARGAEIVTNGPCAACHRVRGTPAAGRVGPDLTHVGARRSLAAGALPFSRGAIQGWVVNPQAIKPGTTMPAVPLEPADADAVARYLERLT